MYRKSLPFVFLLLQSLLLVQTPLAAVPMEHQGKVVGVPDPEILRVRGDKATIEVRLYGIDCPDRGQRLYLEAKKQLRDMAMDQEVVVRILGLDAAGMPLGVVLSGERNLNEEMLREGYAWSDKNYPEFADRFQSLEDEARGSKLGIWRIGEVGQKPLTSR